MDLRDATAADGEALAALYNPYVRDTIVTFEESPVDGADMAQRVTEVRSRGLPWLVLEEAGALRGYAYASTWKTRAAYRHCAEITVYLDVDHCGRGLGTYLYEALFARLAPARLHVLLGCIALPNEASVALHEKFGLRKVAHFAEVGRKFGRWIDVGYWQRILEPGA